jgi:hypothetical protein
MEGDSELTGREDIKGGGVEELERTNLKLWSR